MLEKIKRKKIVNRQDMSKPKSIDELLQKYDFENKDIYDYLDYLVNYLNEKGV